MSYYEKNNLFFVALFLIITLSSCKNLKENTKSHDLTKISFVSWNINKSISGDKDNFKREKNMQIKNKEITLKNANISTGNNTSISTEDNKEEKKLIKNNSNNIIKHIVTLPKYTGNKVCFKYNSIYLGTDNNGKKIYSGGLLCIKKDEFKWKKYIKSVMEKYIKKGLIDSGWINWWLIDPIFYNSWGCYLKYFWGIDFVFALFCFYENNKVQYKWYYKFRDGVDWCDFKWDLKYIYNNSLHKFVISNFISAVPIDYQTDNLNFVKKIIRFKNKLNINGVYYVPIDAKIQVWLSPKFERLLWNKFFNGVNGNTLVYKSGSLNKRISIIYKEYVKKILDYAVKHNYMKFHTINILYPGKETGLPFNVIVIYGLDVKKYFWIYDAPYWSVESYPIVDKSFAKKYGYKDSFKVKYWQLKSIWKKMDGCGLKNTDNFTCNKINSDYWICIPDVKFKCSD